DFAFDIDRDLFGQIAVGHGRRHLSDVADLSRQIACHGIDAVRQVLPGAGHAADDGLPAQPAFAAYFPCHTGHFGGERAKLIDHGVDGVLQLQDFAFNVHRDLLGKVAVGDRGGYIGDVADRRSEASGHRVDAVCEVLPSAGDALYVGLAAQPASR